MWFLLVHYILKNIWKCYDYKQTFWWWKQSYVLHFLCIANANAHICQTSKESTLVIMSILKNYILKKEKVMQNNSRACQFLKDYLSNWSMKLTASKTVQNGRICYLSQRWERLFVNLLLPLSSHLPCL